MAAVEILPGFFKIGLPIPRGGFESFIDGWFIKDRERGQTILIETGPASAVPKLLESLREMDIQKIDYLIYTHIHLDHAGGVGHFMKQFPDTKVLAPEKGRKHLVDPSRLIAGSRSSLGSLCDTYGEPLPIPAGCLLDGPGQIKGLTVVDTPGHAPHHSSYIYELNGKRILFIGEAAGCWFRLPDGSCFMRPATPHKFFYDTEMESLNKLLDLKNIDIACFPHSGCTQHSHEVMERAKAQLELWLKTAEALPAGAGPEEMVQSLTEADPMMKKLEELPENVRRREEYFIRQSSKGFLGWVNRQKEQVCD